ncbi:hypothetical protein CVT25_002026 [Psilocybe cyanescens]|uniref:Uncharacterized protein n=1 Tax=Psilocybe cyanescens TaxID=93625 RepID=A0A409X079_PSICY|nr:hypothetical protein CVT25_002026 [Psilocybe cyanescens]
MAILFTATCLPLRLAGPNSTVEWYTKVSSHNLPSYAIWSITTLKWSKCFSPHSDLYYLAFPNDPLRSKAIVYSVYILELVQTTLIARTLYDEFVFGFLNIDSLDRIGEIRFAVPIAGGIVTFIVQSFYVHRVVQLGNYLGKRRVLAIACAVVFSRLASGMQSDLPSSSVQRAELAISNNATLLTTFLMGAYTIVYLGTLYLYLTRKAQQRFIVLSAITLLYLIGATQFGIQWYLTLFGIDETDSGRETAFIAIFNVPTWIHLLIDITSFCMFIVADGLLIWRCFYVCSRSLRLIIVPVFLLFVETALFLSSIIFIVAIRGQPLDDHQITVINDLQSSGFYISFGTTLTTTVLIAYRIYSVSRDINDSRSRFTHIIEVIIQSALVYSIVVLIAGISGSIPGGDGFPTPTLFSLANYSSSLLVPAAGIAPTIMVARVSLAASIDDPLATRPVNMTMLEFQRYAHSSVNIEPTRIGVVGMNEAPSINSQTLFLGILFNAGGLDVLSVQLCIYYLAFPKDSFRFKTLVYGVYALEVIQTIMLCRTLFSSFVYGFLNENILDQIGDLWFSIPILGGLVSFLVQIFYAYRIILLGRLWENSGVNVIALTVAILACVQMGGGLALGIELKTTALFTRIKSTQIRLAAGIWYAGEAVGDIVIAISMTYIVSSLEFPTNLCEIIGQSWN